MEKAASGEGEGGGGGEGEGEGGKAAPKTVNINGKDVPIETLSSAMGLYTALADENTGKEIIEQLARRTGLLKEDDTKITPKIEKALEGKFTKLMKQKLGKDYDKFSDMLGPLFDEHIDALREEIKSEVSGKAESGDWEAISEAFIEDNKFTPELEKEMTRLINRNGGRPAGLKGKAAREYLKDMYDLAAHKLGLTDDDLENDDEPDEREARRGVRGRTRNRRSLRDEIPDFREEPRPKGPLSIDQIVDAAMRGVRYKT